MPAKHQPGKAGSVGSEPADEGGQQDPGSHIAELEAKLTRLEQLAGVGMYEWITGQEHITWTPQVAKIYGLESTTPRYEELFALIHPDDRAQMEREMEANRAQGGAYAVNFRIIRPDGSIRYLEDAGEITLNADHSAQRIFGVVRDVTERIEAQERIRRREEQFRILADNLPGAAFLSRYDERLSLVYLSENITALTGYPQQEFMDGGLNFTNLIHPDDRGQVDEFHQAVRQQERFRLRYRILTREGEIRWIEERGGVIRRDGEIAYIEGYLEDITRKKKEEDAQQQYMDQLKLLSDATFESIFLSKQGVCIGQNLTAQKMFGYSDEEAIGRMDSEWVVESDRELLLENVRRGTTRPYRATALRKDGSTFPCEIQGRPVEFKGEHFRVTALRDLSVERGALDALSEREEQLATLINSMPDAVMFKDAAGRWMEVNDYSARLFRVEGQDYIGKTDLELAEDNPEFADALRYCAMTDRQAWEAGGSRVDEVIPQPDGTSRVFDVIKVPTYNPDGSPKGLVIIGRDITERKQTEEALRESEERYRSLIENVSDLVYALDPDGRFTYISPNWLEHVGEPAEAAIGKLAEEYTHPEDVARCRQYFEEVLSGRSVNGSVRYRVIRRTGQVIWQTAKGSPQYDESGEIVGYIAIARDVTAEYAAQQALRESEERFRTIIENLPDAVFSHHLDGSFVLVNQAACDNTGYSREELLAMTVADIDHGSVTRRDREEIWHKLDQGQTMTIEGVHHRKDGTTYPAEININAITLDGEKTLLAIVRDVTEREQALAALRDSEARFRHLAETAPVGVYLTSTGNTLVYVNDEILKIFDLPEETVRAGGWLECVHPDDRERVVRDSLKAVEENRVANFEYRVIRPDGSLRWVRTIGRPLFADDGAYTGSVGMLVDTTQLKKAEAALRDSEERFRTIAENTSDGIAVSEHGEFTYISPAYCRLTGYEREEIQQRSVDDIRQLLHADDRDAVFDAFDAAVAAKQPTVAYSYRMLHGDGSYIWREDSIRLFYGAEGELVKSIVVCRDITERKRAEIELRESRERLELALSAAELGTWDWNIATGEVVFNERWAEMLGYELSDVESTTELWEASIHPADRERVMRVLEEHLTGKTPVYETEHRVQHKNGHYIWILDRGRVIERDADGKPLRACGTHLDITERVEREVQYERLLKTAIDGVWLVDPRGVIIECNRAAATILGYSVEELCGMEIPAIDEENSPELVRERVERIKSEGSTRFEARHRRKDGKVIDVEVSATYIPYGGGRILVFTRDVTERKRVEEAIRESERLYRTLAANFPNGVLWLFDRDLRYLFCDGLGLKDAGLDKDELIGRTVYEVWDEDLLREIVPASQAVFEGQASRYEVTYKGNVYENFMFPCYREDGEIHEAICVTMNIQWRVEQEAKRRELEEQLRQSQKLEAIGVLAGGIAHDFNNILFAILGYADLLKSSPGISREDGDLVDEIITGGNRAADLVRQILTFARRTDRKRRELNLIPIIKEAGKLLRSTVPANIDISLELEIPSATVVADPIDIHQIVMNLATNALQAMAVGGGDLKICLSHEPDASGTGPGWYRLLVRDTGPGIAKELQYQIFDPFFTTKEVGKGTGMGLAVVHSIIQDLGGQIEVRSEPGAGAEFCVRLPAAETEMAEPVAAPAELPRGTESIMVVDDEEAITRIMRRVLDSLGYQVTTYNSGTSALAAFSTNPDRFDGAIIDQAMPQMTGSELSQLLLKKRPGFPIVICTGYSEGINARIAAQMGISQYLPKPVTRHELARAVRDALDGKPPLGEDGQKE